MLFCDSNEEHTVLLERLDEVAQLLSRRQCGITCGAAGVSRHEARYPRPRELEGLGRWPDRPSQFALP